jgi:hypothetical protein
MRRRISVVLLAALATVLLVSVAHATVVPVPSQSTNGHGRRSGLRVSNPNNLSQYATVLVDLHFGYYGTADPNEADAIRAVGQILNGPGTRGGQINVLRVGYDGHPELNQDDCRPAKGSVGLNSNNGRSPCDPLNWASDYIPDTNIVNGYSDWQGVRCGDPLVRARLFGQVRFTDGTLRTFEFASNYVDADTNGCTTTADVTVTKEFIDGEGNPITQVSGTQPQLVFMRLTVTNHDPVDDAINVSVNDTLPNGLDISALPLSCSEIGDPNTEPDVLTCNLNTVQNGSAEQVQLIELATRPSEFTSTTVTNTATVFSSNDANAGNNSGSDSFQVVTTTAA